VGSKRGLERQAESDGEEGHGRHEGKLVIVRICHRFTWEVSVGWNGKQRATVKRDMDDMRGNLSSNDIHVWVASV